MVVGSNSCKNPPLLFEEKLTLYRGIWKGVTASCEDMQKTPVRKVPHIPKWALNLMTVATAAPGEAPQPQFCGRALRQPQSQSECGDNLITPATRKEPTSLLQLRNRSYRMWRHVDVQKFNDVSEEPAISIIDQASPKRTQVSPDDADLDPGRHHHVHRHRNLSLRPSHSQNVYS